MPLDIDDLPIVRPIVWFFRHVIFELIFENFFFSLICIPIGWILLRFFTVGRVPDADLGCCMKDEYGDGVLPGLVGVAVVVAVGAAVWFLGGD